MAIFLASSGLDNPARAEQESIGMAKKGLANFSSFAQMELKNGCKAKRVFNYTMWVS
jgi:hypothetical protein